MERYIEKDGKHLRLGYTTGSCAAAAAKAAAWMLLSGRRKETVSLLTPKGIELELAVRETEFGDGFVRCAIEKDGGDDPDITTGALIFARVRKTEAPGITIDGGLGVGRVTRPGLDQAVGSAAINSVPRQMILENVSQVMELFDCPGGLEVLISVPQGEELAKKTFNPRLGIVGGISILGTTGIVEPMSEAALIDTIRVELRQRKAAGAEYVLLTPGNYGAEFIRDGLHLDPDRAVQVSNYIGDALDVCRELGFRGVLLIGHIGKLVKLAGNMLNTHSRYGDCRMPILASFAGAEGLPAAQIAAVLNCVSCDDALTILETAGVKDAGLKRLMDAILYNLRYRAGSGMDVGCAMFSKVFGLLGVSENAPALAEKIYTS
ncbi:MAG: cobalt-precorrin-5B (C(1))-methyltransferase CbiD [Faecousia sp.]